MLKLKPRYIVIEGPIGAGKTTLAQCLAQHLGAHLLLEAPDENPYLSKFYQDMPRYALPAQLFFLSQRLKQMQSLQQTLADPALPVVADFLFEKDALFAELNLRDDDLKLYNDFAARLQPLKTEPDLVIYLQSNEDNLVQRVQARSRPYERALNPGYLSRVAQSYSQFFHQYESAPVLMVNSDHLDFLEGADDLAWLIQAIQNMRGQREFINRA